MQKREQMLVILREMKPKQKGGTAFKKKMHKERSQTETVTERIDREKRERERGKVKTNGGGALPPVSVAASRSNGLL